MAELVQDEAGDDEGALEKAGHRHIGDAAVDDGAGIDDDLPRDAVAGQGQARQVAREEVGELPLAAHHDDDADEPQHETDHEGRHPAADARQGEEEGGGQGAQEESAQQAESAQDKL